MQRFFSQAELGLKLPHQSSRHIPNRCRAWASCDGSHSFQRQWAAKGFFKPMSSCCRVQVQTAPHHALSPVHIEIRQLLPADPNTGSSFLVCLPVPSKTEGAVRLRKVRGYPSPPHEGNSRTFHSHLRHSRSHLQFLSRPPSEEAAIRLALISPGEGQGFLNRKYPNPHDKKGCVFHLATPGLLFFPVFACDRDHLLLLTSSLNPVHPSFGSL